MSEAIVKSNETSLAPQESESQIISHLDRCNLTLNAVNEWITTNFEPGIDFGIQDDRSTKETLLLPGSEKVCKFSKCYPTFEMDRETWEMLGAVGGNVCYKCVLISELTGEVVGEGRGAWDVKEKPARSINKGIKIAEKRAFVDATKRTFCLSGRFTQDSPEHRSKFLKEKDALKSDVAMWRKGVESSLSTNAFLVKVAKSHLHELPSTIGAIRELRSAIVDKEMYDPGTGDRIPE